MNVKSLLVVVLVLAIGPVYASETGAVGSYEEIVMTNGKVHVGEIIEVTETQLRMATELGTEVTLNRANISSQKIVEKNGSYLSLAGTVGMPAVFNVLIQYTAGRWVWGGEGLYLATASGAQVFTGVLLTKYRYFQQILKLNAGYSRFEDASFPGEWNQWTYVGPSYTLQIGNVLLDLGLSVGLGSYTNPQAMFQIGYIQNFN